VGSCVYRKNHCDLQPWAQAVHTLPAVPRSTQPFTSPVDRFLWQAVTVWWLFWVLDGACDRPLNIASQTW